MEGKKGRERGVSKFPRYRGVGKRGFKREKEGWGGLIDDGA